MPSTQDQQGLSSPSGIEEVMAKYNVDSFSDRLRYLHVLLIADFESPEEHLRAYLEAGCAFFGVERASFARVDEDESQYDVVLAVGTPAKVEPGMLVSGVLNTGSDLGNIDPGSALVIKNKTPVATADCLSGRMRDVDYNRYGIGAFIGAPIIVYGQLHGVISFVSSAPRGQDFSAIDLETVDLMAKGVAKMTELQRLQYAEVTKSPSVFATAGIKTFAEYVTQARLPEVYGIPGRVVEVLERRIGKSSLAIDYVAEELNLSKRTLQRRLQQQNISFAELRDQIRFHHSIQCLVEQSQSIDSISASLDFSDRTSFTNAFKRWTGLSPSTFRKLFRDYT